MKQSITHPFGIISVLVLFLMCPLKALASDKISVFVSIPPQAFFVERVGGNLVKVNVLVGPGKSPLTYEPTPRQMVELSNSKVLFTSGVPFEETIVPKIRSSFKNLMIVSAISGIHLKSLSSVHTHVHEHEHKNTHNGEHESHRDHGKPVIERADPHTWLDPILAKKQAKNICDALIEIDQHNKAIYSKNLETLHQKLDRLNKQINDSLKGLKSRSIYVFHPAYGYFCDRYGLTQIPVEIEGKKPSPKQLADLIDRAKEQGVKVIFTQPQFDSSSAETIAEAIGGAVVPLDPLSRDYISNLKNMTRAVRAALNQ